MRGFKNSRVEGLLPQKPLRWMDIEPLFIQTAVYVGLQWASMFVGGKIGVVESYESVSASLLLHGKENEWSCASKQLTLGTRVVLFAPLGLGFPY